MPTDNQHELLEFPCEFPLKVMGASSAAFEEIVAEIVKSHVDETLLMSLNSRTSSGGKYVSVTAVFEAQNRVQLDALYRELSGHPLVLMVL